VENEECGKCEVWKMRSVENGSVENEDCGKLEVTKTPRFPHSALMLLKREWGMGNENGKSFRLIVDNADIFIRAIIDI